MRTPFLQLSAVILVTVACAQDQPEAVLKAVNDVKVGMSREKVLSGLCGRYECVRLDKGDIEESVWAVQSKSVSDGASAKIAFRQGKTLFVTISLYPAMTGDAVRLAERLYRLLELESETPSPQTVADKLSHRRYALLPIELQDIRGDKIEDLDIGFTIGGQQFSIHVTKLEGFPDEVELRRHIDGPLQ